jgi:photosystem II stability/assembly factor-like uncharacterized protein
MKKIIQISILFLMFFISNSNLYSDWKKIENLPKQFEGNYWLDVFFLPANPNYGWVCGYKGMIVRTIDGGKTWDGVQIDANDQLESIMFVDEKVGYTSGMRNSGFDNFGQIYKTIDGGKTWTGVTPKNAHSLWGNYFLDANTGWVIGGGCNGEDQSFFRTTNGGKSWDQTTIPAGNAGLTDLIMTPSGEGYASASGMLLKTVDGGKTWKKYCTTGPNDWQEEITHFSNTFLVPFDEGCSGSQATGGVRISTDNGNTWHQYVTGESMYGAFLLSEKKGWACGFNEAIYYTEDGGATWEKRNCGMDPGASLDDIWFINENDGWVVGDGIYHTYTYPKLTPVINLPDSITICSSNSLILKTTDDFKNYLWSDGQRTPSIKVSKSGDYWVKVWSSRCDSAKSNTIKVNISIMDSMKLNVPKENILCGGDSLNIKLLNKYAYYAWSNGSKDQGITVKNDGWYFVTVKNSAGCELTDSIHVVISPLPKPEIIQNFSSKICKTDSLILSTKEKYSQYIWYDADSKKILQQGTQDHYNVLISGNYYVKVINSNGCEGISAIKNVNYAADSNRVEIMLDLNQNDIRIDSTYPGDINCGKLKIKNYTDQPAVIENLYFQKNSAFSIPKSQLPVYLKAFEEKSIDVCFSPDKIGDDNDTVIVEDVCNNHIIKVVSYGLKNVYYGDSKCGLTIKLLTQKLSGHGSVSMSEPVPNPASTKAKVNFYTEDSKGVNFKLSYKIIDRLGETVYSTEPKNISIYNNTDYDIDITHLNSGYYYLMMCIDGSYIVFPIIIEK